MQRQQHTCTFSSLDQTVSENIPQSRFHGEICCSTSDRDEEVWTVHFPLVQHHVKKIVDLSFTLNTNVLNTHNF